MGSGIWSLKFFAGSTHGLVIHHIKSYQAFSPLKHSAKLHRPVGLQNPRLEYDFDPEQVSTLKREPTSISMWHNCMMRLELVKIYNKWNYHCRLNLSFYSLEHWLTSLLEHGRYLLSTLTHLALWKRSHLFMVGCLEDTQLLQLTIQKRPLKMGTMEADFSHMDSVQGDSFFSSEWE